MFRGEDVLEVARKYIGAKYVLGARAVLANKDHKGPWDCAELASWCCYQAYGIVFGTYGRDPRTADAYSGKWWEDAQKAGTLISLEEAFVTPGAVLLRKPGANAIGHVGFSRGDGGTVEARGRAYGVVETEDARGRAWDGGALVPGVEYSQGAPLAPPARVSMLYRVRHPFMRGEVVERIQKALRKRGFHPGRADGVYGPLTEASVFNFQAFKGLAADGMVGPETARALGIDL
ncbi:peptidoglycan-binding protein [Maricaulis sp. MIT060901]|uniref:C40 family peptidase n=1 Tax=Maricaulis sp. MIT060901 TaxID=3096993 RepID=UPI00399C3F1D